MKTPKTTPTPTATATPTAPATPTPATAKQATPTPVDFATLLDNFAKLYPVPGATTLSRKEIADRQNKYELALFQLSLVCSVSVVKKLIDPTRHNNNPDRQAVVLSDSKTDPATGKRLYTHYSDGEKATAIKGGCADYFRQVYRELKTVNKLFDSIMDSNPDPILFDVYYCDSFLSATEAQEFISVAQVAIVEECKKQLDRDGKIDLARPYTVKRLKKKVYIQKPDSVKGFETVETCPIVEVYRAIRRYVIEQRSIKTDPKNGYTYIEDLKYCDPDDSNPDDSNPTTVYRRLPKYADLCGQPTDSNPGDLLPGMPSDRLTGATVSTADRQAVADYDTIMEELNLTDRQAQVVVLRLKGYGQKAIGTYLGVSKQAVAKIQKQVAVKWKKTGRPDPTDPATDPTDPATDPATPTDNRPTVKKTMRKYHVVYHAPTPTPTPTNSSIFGLQNCNRVVNGQLIGRDGKKPDSWL